MFVVPSVKCVEPCVRWNHHKNTTSSQSTKLFLIKLNNLLLTSGNTGSGAVAATLGLTYAVVRECAMTVWERLYPDETGALVPRWKLNRTTKALKFSHKWVIGLLKRVQQGGDGAITLSEADISGMGDAIGGYIMAHGDEDGEDDSSDDEDEA